MSGTAGYTPTLAHAIRATTQAEADSFFEELVRGYLKAEPKDSRWMAEHVQRSNLAYYAAYHGDDVRARVEALYRCPLAERPKPRETP